MQKAGKRKACALGTALLLSLCLCACSSAEEPATETSVWDGTSVDTSWYSEGQTEYTIDSAAGFAGLAQLVDDGETFEGATVNLVVNVDLAGNDWEPIGGIPSYDQTLFAGTFDGHNNKITGFYTISAEGYQGLFTSVYGGTLKNFYLQGSIKGRESTAGVACCATNENFENIVVDVDIFSTNYYKNVSTGGLVGVYFADGGEYHITNCVNNGTIDANNYQIAGLIGSAGLTEGTSLVVENCSNRGYVNADQQGTKDDESIGGLIGTLGAYGSYTLRNCSNEGEVYASDLKCVGGLVGYVQSAETTFEDCTNTGNVSTGTLNEWAIASGICGTTIAPDATFTNCTNTGALSTYNGSTEEICNRGSVES